MAECKRQTNCPHCGGYIFKGDTFCHVCQNAYNLKDRIVKTEQSTQPPKGYRLLRVGEKVRRGDLYNVPNGWIPINGAWIGMEITKKCRPAARKEKKK